MTTAADDQLAEQAFEAYLAGRAVPAVAGGVAAFADAVRATATVPARPSAALAELLATGLLPDPCAHPEAPRQPGVRRRRSVPVFLSALLSKILAAGALAQAAAGAGVVVVGVSTAGMVGVLPAPAQHGFATVVNGMTPLHVADTTTQTGASPTGTSTATGTGATPTDTTPTSATTTTSTTPASTSTSTSTTPSNFGQQIAGHVEHGEFEGRRVSDLAHEKKTTAAPSGTVAVKTPEQETEEQEREKAEDAKVSPSATATPTASAGRSTESGHGGRR